MTRTVHTCWEGSYRSLLQLCSWALDEPRDQEPKNLLLTLQDVPVHPLDRPGTGILGVPAKQLECCALGLMLPAAWLLTCEMLQDLSCFFRPSTGSACVERAFRNLRSLRNELHLWHRGTWPSAPALGA